MLRRKLSFELVIGFVTGIVASYVFCDSPFFVTRTDNSECDTNQDLEALSEKNIHTEPNKAKYIPSLQVDWAEVQCAFTNLSPDNQNLFDYLIDVTLTCDKKIMIGGMFHWYGFDGEKWCCLDRAFDFKRFNCTALSFGISDDWTFDDYMDQQLGCKVYAFDPTISVNDHQRSPNIKFFKMGISDGSGVIGGGKVDKYSSILKMLSLENSVIDYLKMDVEESEFPFLRDVLTNSPNLLKNVRQIGMEIHLTANKGFEAEDWKYFQHLECLGFRLMFTNFNPTVEIITVDGKRRTSVYEIVWGQQRPF